MLICAAIVIANFVILLSQPCPNITQLKGSDNMATDTRIVKALENLGKELNHINANLQALCSILKDSKETVDNGNLCDHCTYYSSTDDGFCVHGDACHRLVEHFMA